MRRPARRRCDRRQDPDIPGVPDLGGRPADPLEELPRHGRDHDAVGAGDLEQARRAQRLGAREQRPSGTLYAETGARVIFLGALALGDETTALSYSLDRKRDMAGYIERVAIGRWRLVLPWPNFESQLDVIEMVPAG